MNGALSVRLEANQASIIEEADLYIWFEARVGIFRKKFVLESSDKKNPFPIYVDILEAELLVDGTRGLKTRGMRRRWKTRRRRWT